MLLSNNQPMSKEDLLHIANGLIEGLGGKVISIELDGMETDDIDGIAYQYAEWTIHLDCPGFCAKDVKRQSHYTLTDD